MAYMVATVSDIDEQMDAITKVSAVRSAFKPGPIESVIAKMNGLDLAQNINLPKINLGVEQVLGG